jgi:hypothetical protein
MECFDDWEGFIVLIQWIIQIESFSQGKVVAFKKRKTKHGTGSQESIEAKAIDE